MPTPATPLAAAPFVERHIGPSRQDEQVMLDVVGHSDITALVRAAVPESILLTESLALDAGRSEPEVLAELRELAGRNTVLTSMIGMGYHGTHVPGVIQRNVLENPAWYTAYTPYQPEISQGRLEALINFQTMIADLTGLTTANASMLDESTAVVEGMLLALRASKSGSRRFIVDTDAFPQTHALLVNRAATLGIELAQVALTERTTAEDLGDYFGVFV